jgi:hypothetical protein
MTETSAQMGTNRTGMETSPKQAKAMIEGAQQGTPHAASDLAPQKALRSAYIDEHDKLGSVPPPGNLKGMAKSGMEMLKGNKANVLIDKLGERLAFERTGTRLYEAVITKAERNGAGDGTGPELADLRQVHDEELAHFHMLKRHMERLGADPTAVTPAADVAGVASSGLLGVAADPRTTLHQSLEAVLIAELADNEGWEMLIKLAKDMGQDDMASEFQTALKEEERHLALVRGWVSAHKHQEAKLA